MRDKRRWAGAIGSALFYMAVGPLAGLATLLLLLWLVELFQNPHDLAVEDAGSLLLGAPLLIFFSYMFGAVPALMTGLLAGSCLPVVVSPRHAFLAGLIGACVGAACALPLVPGGAIAAVAGGRWCDFDVLWLLAGPGFVAALFCAWLRSRRARAVADPAAGD